jgi:hypothetical protein
LFDCDLNDVAIALAMQLPRFDDHRSVEVWIPVWKSKFIKVVQDVDADPCDDVVPIAARVPELCDPLVIVFMSW